MTRHATLRDWTRAGIVTGTADAAWLAGLLSPRRRAHTGAPRILLVRPDHVGDALLTTPAIAALRATLPDARLIALAGPWAAQALANNPHLDEIHVFPFPGMARELTVVPLAPYIALVRAARRVARWRVDAAINFRPDFWWGAALLALAGIPIRLGYDRPPGGRAFTHRVAWPAAPEHAAQSALRLADAAGEALGTPHASAPPWTPDAHPLVFPLDDDAHAWADGWLARAGLPTGARPLLVHPGAGAAVKLWTADAWARVCRRLAADTGAPVIVAGAAAESDLVLAITQAARSPGAVVPFAEDVPLARYAALLASARLVVGVDSGALHLATAVGTPTVRLFGPTDPAIFGPWGPSERHRVVRGAALPCMPCGRLDYRLSELPAHPCVRLIHPDAVVAAALDLLRRDACDENLPELPDPSPTDAPDEPQHGAATMMRSNRI